MPLKLNIGLCRKIGEANYGSRGANVNVELEVDSSLVAEPEKLKDRIRHLFGLVRTSLAEELNGGNGHNATDKAGSQDGGQPSNGNGQRNESGQKTAAPRPATQSQIKALFAITKSQGQNLNQLLRERFRVGKPEQLSIREASQLIDALKSPDRQEGG
jgi:hypothetical protein